MIYEYQSSDAEQMVDCLIELHAAESQLKSIGITGRNVAQLYFKEVQNKISNNSGQIFVAKQENEVTGILIVNIEENEIYEKSGKHLLIMDIVVKHNFRNE